MDTNEENLINCLDEDIEFYQIFWINLTNFYIPKKLPSLHNISFIEEDTRKRFKFTEKNYSNHNSK